MKKISYSNKICSLFMQHSNLSTIKLRWRPASKGLHKSICDIIRIIIDRHPTIPYFCLHVLLLELFRQRAKPRNPDGTKLSFANLSVIIRPAYQSLYSLRVQDLQYSISRQHRDSMFFCLCDIFTYLSTACDSVKPCYEKTFFQKSDYFVI